MYALTLDQNKHSQTLVTHCMATICCLATHCQVAETQDTPDLCLRHPITDSSTLQTAGNSLLLDDSSEKRLTIIRLRLRLR